MKLLLTIIATVLVISFISCEKKKLRFSTTPAIDFVAQTPDSMKAGGEDTLFIQFHFTDGDADLTPDAGIYVKDSRDTALQSYFFPDIPNNVRDPQTGLEGTCTFYIPGAAILIDDTTKARDTVQYSVYIKDAAGNQSNTIQTRNLYLLK